MRKILLLLLLFASFEGVGQTTKAKTDSIIDKRIGTPVRPSDIATVAKQLSLFANQADSTAKTKEPFVVPGSSSSYWNGLKQWVTFPSIPADALLVHKSGAETITGFKDFTAAPTRSGVEIPSLTSAGTFTNKVISGTANTVTGLNWSAIGSGKPTSVAGYGITDALTLTGVQAVSGKTGLISQWTNDSGYANLIALDTANIARKNKAATISAPWNFTTTPTISGVDILSKSSSGTVTNKILSGVNNSFSNIPSTAITNTSFVDLGNTQNVTGPKTWLSTGLFTGDYANFQAVFGSTGQAARVAFTDGSGLQSGVIGYGAATSSGVFQVRASSSLDLVTASDTRMRVFPSGNIQLKPAGGTFNERAYNVDLQGTILLGGATTMSGNMLPASDLMYSIGSTASRFSEVRANSLFGSTILGTGAVYYGSDAATNNAIYLRQGAATKITGGFFGDGSGNVFLQAPGVVPANTGDRLAVYGNFRSGNASIQGGMEINGNTNMYSGAYVGQDLHVVRGLEVEGDVLLDGGTRLLGDLDVGLSLLVSGESNLLSDVTIYGHTDILSSLQAQGDLSGESVTSNGVLTAQDTSFLVGGTVTPKLNLSGILSFANNAAALTGGLVAGDVYYTIVGTDWQLKIVH